VSSAYRTKFIPRKCRGKSLIYTKNKSGPRIEPWGTPFGFTLDRDEYLFSILLLLPLVCVIETYCVRSDKYDLNHAFIIPLTPYDSSLYSRMLWFITLYALVKSRNIPTACKLLSKACCIFSIKGWQAVIVDLLSLKPFCSSVKILNFF
jgi:hypothetical protein